jgi:DMSO/TMAO reductase YedYZ molybdopterin-dependent catalytic subunit
MATTSRKFVTQTPENSETPLESLRSWVTPTRLFFVRNHFNTPELDLNAWRLSVTGCVEHPLALSWDDLNALPQRRVSATVECAGNGRSFLRPVVEGVPWGAGAIAHAEWAGVPVHLVLERAGICPESIEVVFIGGDTGTEPDHPERMHFARSLPISKALHPDTLLATEMNGEPLEPNHGFPVRLLVPGWYGVASVKWLTHIELVKEPFSGYFQTRKYTVKRHTADGILTRPVQAMAVKSTMIRPRAGESLAVGPQRVFGVAWAGEDRIERVEVSTDGGGTWANAQLLGPHDPYSWTMWEYTWQVDQPGTHTLLARATSSSGSIQPQEHDPLNGGYMISFTQPVEVSVVKSQPVQAKPIDSDAILYDMSAFAQANVSLPLDVNLEYSYGAGI